MTPFIERFLEIQKLNKITIFLKNYYARFHLIYIWKTLRINPLAIISNASITEYKSSFLINLSRAQGIPKNY